MTFPFNSYIFLCSLLNIVIEKQVGDPLKVNYFNNRTLPGINRVTPACETNFHSSFGGALCIGTMAHILMIEIFSDTVDPVLS